MVIALTQYSTTLQISITYLLYRLGYADDATGFSTLGSGAIFVSPLVWRLTGRTHKSSRGFLDREGEAVTFIPIANCISNAACKWMFEET